MTAAFLTTRNTGRLDPVRLLRMLLPAIALALMLAVIFSQQPRAMSYVGLTLLLNLAVPVILATLSQLCIIAINDLDLSIGSFVGLCACIAATLLKDTPLLGWRHWRQRRRLWAGRSPGSLARTAVHRRDAGTVLHLDGLAVLILPTPGAQHPEFLTAVMKWKPDLSRCRSFTR